MDTENIKIALADDHVLLRNGLAELIKKLNYTVLYQTSNGEELIRKIQEEVVPDLVLMDINMPEMDGYETTQWLRDRYPQVKVLALSMYDDETSIIRMLKSGARGYILKASEAQELRRAIENVSSKGYHYSELVTGPLIHLANDGAGETKKLNSLNDKEKQFLKWASTELTYKEIAHQMHVSHRTVDGYREALFEKLNVKSRVGLVLFAIKNRIVLIN